MKLLAIIIVLIAIIAIYIFRKICHKSPPAPILKNNTAALSAPKKIIELHPNAQIETWGSAIEKTEDLEND